MYSHTCCCNNKKTCCGSGMDAVEEARGLYEASGQVCAWDPLQLVTVTFEIDSYWERVTTGGAPGPPGCNPTTDSKTCDGTIVMESDDPPVGGFPAFSSFCGSGVHFITFISAADDALDVDNFFDDTCGPPSTSTGSAGLSVLTFRPFSADLSAAFLDVKFSLLEFALDGAGNVIGVPVLFGPRLPGTVVSSAGFTAGSDCHLVITANFSYDNVSSAGGLTHTEHAEASVTITIDGLNRCNP